MNEFTHLNAYAASSVLHERAGTPYHRTAGSGRRERRSTRRAVALGLHRLADRLDV